MRTTQHTEPEQKKAPVAPTAEWLELSKEERANWLRHNHKGYLSKEERLRTFHVAILSMSIWERPTWPERPKTTPTFGNALA